MTHRIDNRYMVAKGQMTGRLFELLKSQWFKKDVSLSWNGVHLSLAVAQELFSSHVVDAGSHLLLRSLDLDSLAERGTCVDFGCGYGVLGLAFKASSPAWDVTLIDRDALAVEFSQWNADRLGVDVTCRGGLDTNAGGAPIDLVLWNVPGKAGAGVLQKLTSRVLDCLNLNGTLALVVVHPLARGLEDVVAHRDDIEIIHESAGSEHTVFHMKRVVEATTTSQIDAFAEGLFDREMTDVDTGLISYRFRPVIGIPQYEAPDFATVLLTDSIEAVGRTAIASALCVAPGQGHVPIYLRQRWPDVHVTLADRDLLALRASARALDGDSCIPRCFGAADSGIANGSFDLVTVGLPNQVRPPVMNHLLEQIVDLTHVESLLAVSGGSTEVSRFLALARKQAMFKLRNRDKRKGFSAALFERRTG